MLESGPAGIHNPVDGLLLNLLLQPLRVKSFVVCCSTEHRSRNIEPRTDFSLREIVCNYPDFEEPLLFMLCSDSEPMEPEDSACNCNNSCSAAAKTRLHFNIANFHNADFRFGLQIEVFCSKTRTYYVAKCCFNCAFRECESLIFIFKFDFVSRYFCCCFEAKILQNDFCCFRFLYFSGDVPVNCKHDAWRPLKHA